MANVPELLDAAKWGQSTAVFLRMGFHHHSKLNRMCGFGRVLITEAPRRRHDIVWLYQLQNRIMDFWEGAPPGTGTDIQQAAVLLRQKYDGVRPCLGLLPSRLTHGVPVYMWDHYFEADHMPEREDTKRYRENLLVPCWFDRSVKNRVVLRSLPYTPAMRARRAEQFVSAVRRRGGVRLRAAIVQANNGLWQPGDVTLPACLIFTFDRNVPNPAAYLEGLARRMYRIKGGRRPSNPDDQFIFDRLWEGERRCSYHERNRLPRGFTGGPVVYEASVWIPPGFLRRGMLDRTDAYSVLAEPGDAGGAELLPCWDTGAYDLPEVWPSDDLEEATLWAEPLEEMLPEVDDEDELPEV